MADEKSGPGRGPPSGRHHQGGSTPTVLMAGIWERLRGTGVDKASATHCAANMRRAGLIAGAFFFMPYPPATRNASMHLSGTR
ncbi:hypothetical protein LMG28690_00344 [Paraburkholderia caffeinilytica]|nr:hypothetical protein LMG28690_00344 [Paraburkholderia caffeinilytica]